MRQLSRSSRDLASRTDESGAPLPPADRGRPLIAAHTGVA